MVTTSVTSWIESDPRDTLSAHASFRVTGDALVPAIITDMLGVAPTTAYAKGGSYFAGPRTGNVIGRTGVWLYSTRDDGSATLDDHLDRLVRTIFLDVPHMLKFATSVERRKLKAEFLLFWHGRAGAPLPRPTALLEKLSADVSAPIVMDFDREVPRQTEPTIRHEYVG